MAKPVKQKLKMLRNVPLFRGLSKREITTIIKAGKEIEFEPGSTMVEEGLQAIDFYLIISGEAKVIVGGRRRRVLGPGDYFGEITVLDGGPRSATVVAETRVWTLRLDRDAFVRILDRNGTIGRKLLMEMGSRLREAERAPARSGGSY
jgi:CRP/FNR family cyclic AMP-dependent transcriptional regulator